jgi:hypothetical protein
MSLLTAFLFTGLFSLAWQTYSDLKSKEVDSRRNWFMYGAVLTLAILQKNFFGIYIGAVFFAIGFTVLIRRMYADGDLEALRWTIPGFLVLNWVYGVVYLTAFCFLSLIYVIVRRRLKVKENTAGYTLILGAFVITAAFALGI